MRTARQALIAKTRANGMPFARPMPKMSKGHAPTVIWRTAKETVSKSNVRKIRIVRRADPAKTALRSSRHANRARTTRRVRRVRTGRSETAKAAVKRVARLRRPELVSAERRIVRPARAAVTVVITALRAKQDIIRTERRANRVPKSSKTARRVPRRDARLAKRVIKR